MTSSPTKALAALLLLASPAVAQTTRPAPSTESGSQSSNMGLPPDDNQHANNGVGTEGSLTQDNGTASSTVAGVHHGQTPMGGNSSQGAGKPIENEPAQGGGTQAPK